MTTRPTLLLTVGLPCCGKTTAARRFEGEQSALRLTKDEWMKALYGVQNPMSASDVIEGRLIAIALRALSLGVNVVLDFGLWSRDERWALRAAGTEAGAEVRLWHAPVTLAQQQERNAARLALDAHSTWPMSDEELEFWAAQFEVPTAGELDGSDPIPPPPNDFTTWTDWILWRWPMRIADTER